ncbi:hypothetical protein ACRALDRAFT_211129 [Sodiomyces alcalophilus JCM 7366]|uniref:uncharacterized protein n=1 Tax=Sodiomyces alcalophilus JCM 7366 TaxID=591952 RepID=UPI0039B36EE6
MWKYEYEDEGNKEASFTDLTDILYHIVLTLAQVRTIHCIYTVHTINLHNPIHLKFTPSNYCPSIVSTSVWHHLDVGIMLNS